MAGGLKGTQDSVAPSRPIKRKMIQELHDSRRLESETFTSLVICVLREKDESPPHKPRLDSAHSVSIVVQGAALRSHLD